ncbi:MAG: phosphoenolpyruvate carboxylase, partial [Thermoprotei archaeon]
LMAADSIVEPYAKHAGRRGVRVFIARSDPALNYGLPCAVALVKLALSRLRRLSERGVEAYPIIGVGSLPFRGGLAPHRLAAFLEEYRGVYTATVQSALKYDWPGEEARRTVEELKRRLPSGEPAELGGEEALVRAISKLRAAYEEEVEGLAGLVDRVAMYVPARRARRLHIGLFGYSRGVRGVTLPRAIPFTCAMYSLGAPPELLGLRKLAELGEEEWRALEEAYVNLRLDLEEAARYVSLRNLELLRGLEEFKGDRGELSLVEEDLRTVEDQLGVRLGPKSPAERRHENAVNSFLLALVEGDDEAARRHLLEAARIRRSLG